MARKKREESATEDGKNLSQEATLALAAEMEEAYATPEKQATQRIDSDDRPTLNWEDLPDSGGVRRIKLRVDEVRPVETQYGPRTRLLATTPGGIELGAWLPERCYKGLVAERGQYVWVVRSGDGNDARYRVEGYARNDNRRSRRDGVD